MLVGVMCAMYACVCTGMYVHWHTFEARGGHWVPSCVVFDLIARGSQVLTKLEAYAVSGQLPVCPVRPQRLPVSPLSILGLGEHEVFTC